jgi:hypothetical protein
VNAATTHTADFSPPIVDTPWLNPYATLPLPHGQLLKRYKLASLFKGQCAPEQSHLKIPSPRTHVDPPVDATNRPPVDATFAAIQRPPALWNHADAPSLGDELPPPFGIGHAVHKSVAERCNFAIDTMCRPVSVISASLVQRLGLPVREQHVTTTLAHKSAAPVKSTHATTCELVTHWNGKRRTFFVEAMIWESLPAHQDLIISMPDALDTGLIAFALPHEWRRSWLGTAAFSGKLPAALRQDQSIAMAMHHELVMKEEDEDLIDISQRVALTKAHIVTDVTTLSAAQRYWLAQFPSLNEAIPENAHPDLPKFNPPFNEKEMDQYQGKPPSRIPRCSPKLQDKINDAFSKLSDAKICDLHANPVGVASYVVLVPKPDGSLRICINFSKVNKMLLRHHFPLPACADLLNKIAKHSHYAKIDLYNGFYNFDVDPSAQWLTSTVAPGHALTWRKIPQGLAPVPSWFQWAMQTVLGDYVGTICFVYIDDLIIMADSPDELRANIRKILARLDHFNLRISIKKCDFEPTEEIEFLGHHISKGKIRPGAKSSSILQGIVNPNDEANNHDKHSKLHTFIGICNWFSKYIPDCQRKLLPLLNTKLEQNKWQWGQEQQTCFDMFRDILANLQPLYLPTGSNNKLEVHTDASDHGYFAVLFEDTGVGPPHERLRVIAYAGGVFRKNQLSWSTLQKEMFSMYQAHLKFDPFIRLHEFRLCVDNKTMTFCETSSDAMVQRWYLRIQHYMSEIVHIPGVCNILPDAGSRLLHLLHPNFEQSQFQALSSSFCGLLSHGPGKFVKNSAELCTRLATRALTCVNEELHDDQPISARMATDDESIRNLQRGFDTSHMSAIINACAGSAHHSSAKSASIQSHDWATRPMPRSLASASTVIGLPVSTATTSSDTHLSQWLHDNFPDSASTQVLADNAVSTSASACARRAAEPSSARRPLAIAPEHVHLIRTCHGGACGHHGRDETIRKLQQAGHHWPTRFIDVARYIASCPACQRFRLKHKPPYAMYKTILHDAPLFGRWHMDFLTISKKPCQFSAATKILVMEEERSRYVMLHCVRDETAIEVVIAFLHTFSIFGIPESLYSDNASNLAEASVKEFIRLTGIQHDFSVPKQAHSNGMVERTCGDTSKLLRMLCSDLHAYGRWSLLVPLVQRMLNSLTRSTLGCSANQLVFGNRVNLDRFILPTTPQRHNAQTREAAAQSATVDNFLDSLMIAQQDLLQKGDEIRVKILNDHTRSRPFKPDEELVVGQTVLVPWNDYNKKPTRFAGNFMGPYVVVRIERGHSTVALAHTIVPTPQRVPATLVSAISELRLYDDSLAIVDYDVPEDRFRQLAYIGRNARPVQCIISYRRIPLPDILPATDVNNFEYQVRFEDSTHLDDTAWLPYSSVQHTFAFQSFYGCARRELTGHQCIAIPSALRQVHQSNASTASRRRNRIQHHSVAASDFVASLHLDSGSGSSDSDSD